MKLDRIFEPTELVESSATAAKAVERAACPVAIKLLSRHITHKSDAGGVVLDVATSDHARAAFVYEDRVVPVDARVVLSD